MTKTIFFFLSPSYWDLLPFFHNFYPINIFGLYDVLLSLICSKCINSAFQKSENSYSVYEQIYQSFINYPVPKFTNSKILLQNIKIVERIVYRLLTNLLTSTVSIYLFSDFWQAYCSCIYTLWHLMSSYMPIPTLRGRFSRGGLKASCCTCDVVCSYNVWQELVGV